MAVKRKSTSTRKTSSKGKGVTKGNGVSKYLVPGLGLVAAGYLGKKIISKKGDSELQTENTRLSKALQECGENFQKADKAYREWERHGLILQEEIKRLKSDIELLEKQLRQYN